MRFTQVKYQLYYRIRKQIGFEPRLNKKLSLDFENLPSLKLQPSLPALPSFLQKNNFRFLNLEHQFENEIDWNFADHGKLWTYNLNYFEFLSQPDLKQEEGLRLIRDFIKNEEKLKDGLEPFPISLRAIFWIKFLVQNEIRDAEIDQSLFRQLDLLTKKIEYHLLGNHLIENGFALIFGAYYFSSKTFLAKAKEILIPELEEQILSDGAHFELSPMYHQLMLYRVLDCINLMGSNPLIFSDDLLTRFREKAELMLGWLAAMTFSDGTTPALNDSALDIAPSSQNLLNYGNKLKLKPKNVELNACGYRKHRSKTYELLVDVGAIGPDYIPGHAHSDTFNFVLHHDGKPLIVDTGTSTYEKNALRTQERSTSAHNTVKVGEAEQTDVWGGFRVGRRARITEFSESESSIKATHDGYAPLGIYHERNFHFHENQIEIKDELTKQATAKAYLHFHPTVEIEQHDTSLSGKFGTIEFENAETIALEEYAFSNSFNQTKTAIVAVITFKAKLNTKIQLNK